MPAASSPLNAALNASALLAHRAWRRDATAERLSTLNAERAKRVDEMTEHEARLLQLERTSYEREVEQMMLAQKQLEM